jgi:streptomycin 6-kinase
MAYIHPAKNLNSISDQVQATQITAKLIQQLQKNPPLTNNLPHLRTLENDFLSYLQNHKHLAQPPIPYHKIQRAQHILLSLCASASNDLVLHADLHQQNILQSSHQGWVAIDPKGYIGDPCFETGAFLRNNLLKYPDPAALTKQRIQIFSEILNFSPARILSWSYTQAILAACWCLEEQDHYYTEYLKIADIFESLAC